VVGQSTNILVLPPVWSVSDNTKHQKKEKKVILPSPLTAAVSVSPASGSHQSQMIVISSLLLLFEPISMFFLKDTTGPTLLHISVTFSKHPGFSRTNCFSCCHTAQYYNLFTAGNLSVCNFEF
jgi:hypothetical protein